MVVVAAGLQPPALIPELAAKRLPPAVPAVVAAILNQVN